MGDERLQTISLRIPEETYEQLKKYAEERGESVSDVVRGRITERSQEAEYNTSCKQAKHLYTK